MKSTLESWFSGILASSEIVSADRYSLFVGVLKKRFVWILLGILICQAVFARILFYAFRHIQNLLLNLKAFGFVKNV